MTTLVDHLQDGAWHGAKELGQALGLSDRTIRELASRSGGEVLSGQQGYKLTEKATPEEVDRAVAWLVSQAKNMKERATLIDAVAKAKNPAYLRSAIGGPQATLLFWQEL